MIDYVMIVLPYFLEILWSKCSKGQVENWSCRPVDVKSFIQVIGIFVKKHLNVLILVLANIFVFLFSQF